MTQALVKKQSWWQLLSIQAGGSICLPVIMVGQLICQKFGWLAALLGMGLGNVFLLLIGSLLTSLSAERPQSTVEHAAHCFGRHGRVLFAALMILSMLGWFAIQLNVMSLGVLPLLHLAGIAVSPQILSLSVGLALTCTMCFGMRAIKWVSNVCAPLLGLTLLYAVFSAGGSIPLAAPLTLSWLGGVSLVIGANIAAVIDLPTFFRHARSKRDARLCIVLLYGLVVPLIEAAGIYLFAVTGGGSVTGVLQAGHGLLWMVWTNCFILLSGWATNYTNLYSALTSSYSLSARWSPALRTIALGALGTALACLNPLGNLDGMLEALSITIGGMGAVILSTYLLGKRNSWISMMSWAIGVAVGLCSSLLHMGFTGVPAFDAFMATSIINYLFRRKKDETVDNR